MSRPICRSHDHRVDETFLVPRKSGGSYKRAGSFKPTGICGPCAIDLLGHWTPGHLTASQWSVSGLRLAVSLYADKVRDNRERASAYAALAAYHTKRAEESERRAAHLDGRA